MQRQRRPYMGSAAIAEDNAIQEPRVPLLLVVTDGPTEPRRTGIQAEP